MNTFQFRLNFVFYITVKFYSYLPTVSNIYDATKMWHKIWSRKHKFVINTAPQSMISNEVQLRLQKQFGLSSTKYAVFQLLMLCGSTI